MVKTVHLRCPSQECNEAFPCEVCLNVHLVDLHGVRYADIFGAQDPAFAEFCSNHQDLSPSVLGT